MKFFPSALAALLTLVGSHAEASQSDNPYRWEPITSSVAVFKDGLGFFSRDAPVSLRDGWCVSSELPPAAFGTFAIYSLVDGHLVDVIGAGPGEVTDFDGVDVPDDLETRRERLSASIGLEVELTFGVDGLRHTVAGARESVGPEFVILGGSAGHIAVPIAGTLRMQLLNLPLRIHVVDERGRAPEETVLAMSFLRKGITWIPEYSMEAGEDEAQLDLRATLVNEADDLIHCDVHFMVGVPHFVHSDYMAPIAVGTVIRSLGATVLPNEYRSQIMSRAAIVSNSLTAGQFGGESVVSESRVEEAGKGLAAVSAALPNVEQVAAADYTVFTVQDLTVRKGEKAIVPLLQTTIRFSHLYRWSVPDRLTHQLVLYNDSGTGWTTGPCLVLIEGHPVSQGILRYTPAGGRCELEVTTAVNVAHHHREEEVGRKLKAHSPSHDRFMDLIRIGGHLELKNLEPSPVTIVIERTVPGKPLTASEEGVFQGNSTRLILGQRAGSFRWHITLEPGETMLIEYEYERFVPSS
jgi:hypothetical protein